MGQLFYPDHAFFTVPRTSGKETDPGPWTWDQLVAAELIAVDGVERDHELAFVTTALAGIEFVGFWSNIGPLLGTVLPALGIPRNDARIAVSGSMNLFEMIHPTVECPGCLGLLTEDRVRHGLRLVESARTSWREMRPREIDRLAKNLGQEYSLDVRRYVTAGLTYLHRGLTAGTKDRLLGSLDYD